MTSLLKIQFNFWLLITRGHRVINYRLDPQLFKVKFYHWTFVLLVLKANILKTLRSLMLIDHFHKADVLIININIKKSIVQLVVNWFKNTLLSNKTQCYIGKGMDDFFQIRTCDTTNTKHNTINRKFVLLQPNITTRYSLNSGEVYV